MTSYQFASFNATTLAAIIPLKNGTFIISSVTLKGIIAELKLYIFLYTHLNYFSAIVV